MSKTSKIDIAAIIIIIAFVFVYILALGGLLAFLWNSIVVDTLRLTTATLDLWTGIGLFILINIIGGAFRNVQNRD